MRKCLADSIARLLLLATGSNRDYIVTIILAQGETEQNEWNNDFHMYDSTWLMSLLTGNMDTETHLERRKCGQT